VNVVFNLAYMNSTVIAHAKPPSSGQHTAEMQNAVISFSKAITAEDARDVGAATQKLISAVALNPSATLTCDLAGSPLAGLNPSLLANSFVGRTNFFYVLRSRSDSLRAIIDADQKPRELSSASNRYLSDELAAISCILHYIASAESLAGNRFVRLTALQLLDRNNGTPLLSNLHVLAAAEDPEVKSAAIRSLMRQLAFPLSASTQEELVAAHRLGGTLLGVLCKGVDTTRGRPAWMTDFPALVKQWQLACAGARVESGVSSTDLTACSLAHGGPLNAWQVNYALSPTDPLSFAFFQSGLRRLVGR
jgi:hypothetical protein